MHNSPTKKTSSDPNINDRLSGHAGLAANVITIILGGVSLVQAVSSNPAWILLGIAALMGLIAYWAHRRRWAPAAIGLLVLVIFGAGGWLIAHNNHPAASLSDSSAASGSKASTSPSANAAATASPSPAAGHKTIFDNDIDLSPDQAVDVDTSRPVIASGQHAATNGYDIYYEAEHEVSSADLSVARGMYSISVGMSPAAAYSNCLNHTASQSYAITSTGIYPGSTAFCFVTSDRHLGWAAVKGFDDTTKTATLAVLVWDTVISN